VQAGDSPTRLAAMQAGQLDVNIFAPPDTFVAAERGYTRILRQKDLAPDYVPPPPRTITAMGKDALGNLHYAAWAMHEAGQITDDEVRIAHELAYVLTGGDGPPRVVSERDILDLEREAFLRLAGTKETQERIAHMLKTGKPLRN